MHGSELSVAHLRGGLPLGSRLGVRAEGTSTGEMAGLSTLPPVPLSSLRDLQESRLSGPLYFTLI